MTAARLSHLLQGLADPASAAGLQVAGISSDSRTVEAGWLFVAAPGVRGDGREYLNGAIARGAAAVAYEPDDPLPSGERFRMPDVPVPAIPVPRLRYRIGLIADRFFGSPSQKLFVVGVTGTNGKTTCTHLLAQILDEPGGRCGLIGTLGAGFPGRLDPSSHTTPDPVSVHRLLAGFVAAGAESACMEVSSHALDQRRVEAVAFDVAVFTNLTRDHLDYHGSMESYAQSKARLFEFPGLAAAVINCDDPFGQRLAREARTRVNVTTFGTGDADIRATEIRPTAEGLGVQVMTPAGPVALRSSLIGRFNAMNLLAVLAVLLVAGLPLARAAERIALVRPVSGRMERFGGDSAPLVVVDYAHTPDALHKALAALREHTSGRLWCVFGCGGERDRGKRPLMGRLAEDLADIVIVTDDNPRHESPEQIIADIAGGMRLQPTVVRDRAHAINMAIGSAAAGDAVLIAGKGHETYQQIGDRRLHFSDREVVMEILGAAA
ncbi:MAG: UDP-N-acetylmuramoyl-L-alanyl-D-glutamate--2,6-diaminopimelate ligase [Pseudomonadota bacterium]|nr:UDP-N-acetylmuramoyl-L-alanyl-D-glutamate--2,6-diaminopimelate ligase [Pseudomonadota bacterium]